MPSPSLLRLANLSLVVCGILFGGSTAQATGRWNLPSTVPQFFGYGNGPGYHTPRIRNPDYHPPKVPRRMRMGNGDPMGASVHGETIQTPPTNHLETSPIQELGDSWLAPVPLPVVHEVAAEPAALILLPPVLPLLEAPGAAWIEPSEKIETAPHDRIPMDSLFSAPPLPGNQG